MARRLAVWLVVTALLAGMGQSATVAQQSGCAGLSVVAIELNDIGEQWLHDTSVVGVAYTADPTQFDAADWTAFAELAREKGDRLAGIDPPAWLASWLDVQVNAAELQGAAGDAAASGGLAALMAYGDDFIRLMDRDENATRGAVAHCPAFADVAQEWAAQNRDFEPPQGTPVASAASASR